MRWPCSNVPWLDRLTGLENSPIRYLHFRISPISCSGRIVSVYGSRIGSCTRKHVVNELVALVRVLREIILWFGKAPICAPDKVDGFLGNFISSSFVLSGTFR